MAEGEEKQPEVMDPEMFKNFQQFLLQIGATVSGAPLDVFLNTVEVAGKDIDTIMDISRRIIVKNNLDIMKRTAEALLPFQSEVRKIAEEVEEADKKSGNLTIIPGGIPG